MRGSGISFNGSSFRGFSVFRGLLLSCLLDAFGFEIREVARAGLPDLSPRPIRLEIKIIGEMQTPAPVSFVVLKANQATVVVTVGAGAVE